MIWGALSWDYKLELVFLEKLPGRKGICSKAYLRQVLQPVVFPLFDKLGPECYKRFLYEYHIRSSTA